MAATHRNTLKELCGPQEDDVMAKGGAHRRAEPVWKPVSFHSCFSLNDR